MSFLIFILIYMLFLSIFKFSNKTINKIYLYITILLFNFQLFLFLFLDKNIISLTFYYTWIGSYWFNWYPILGLDGINLPVLLLTAGLIPVILIGNKNIKFLSFHLFSFLLLEIVLILIFVTFDIILFYILFESLLLPLFVIIGIFGSRSNKIYASYLIFFYTLISSILFLLGIIIIYLETGTTNLYIIYTITWDFYLEKILYWLFIVTFLVKLPLMPFHLWLFNAHVEASLGGSVILAGVLLKLGIYGIIRFNICLFPQASLYYSPLLLTFSLISLIFSSLTTIRQTDMKRLIAYSSVSHMSISLLGIFSLSLNGIIATIYLIVSHGLSSSGLFILVTIVYWRFGSRLIIYYRGLMALMPLWSIFFFLFNLASMGFPGFANFITEYLEFKAMIQISLTIALISSISILLSSIYSLFLINRLCFGEILITIKLKIFTNYFLDLNRCEFNQLFSLLISIVILGVNTDVLNLILMATNYLL